MQRLRVVSLIDGLNLHHAIHSLHRPELKWIDLSALSKVFLKNYSEELIQVLYFFSYAEHITSEVQKSQKAHVTALKLRGVTPILGHFKKKSHHCAQCGHKRIGHEEKESDVNLAIFLLDLAYRDLFDRALIVSNDSDLAPAIRMVRERFPQKRITIVTPPQRYCSYELIHAASDKAKIRIEQLERSVLPSVVTDASYMISVSRPHEYMPSVSTNTL